MNIVKFPKLKHIKGHFYEMHTDLVITDTKDYGTLIVRAKTKTGGFFLTDITTCPSFLKPILSDFTSGNTPYAFATAALVHDAFLHPETQIISSKLKPSEINAVRKSSSETDLSYFRTLRHFGVSLPIATGLFLGVRMWSLSPKFIRNAIHSKF